MAFVKTTLTQLRAEVRLWSQPKWVTSYLCDVVSRHAMKLCKALPRIDSFIFSKTEQAENAQLGAQAKRMRVEEKWNRCMNRDICLQRYGNI